MQQTILLYLLMLFGWNNIEVQDERGTIEVVVNNIKSDKGLVRAVLFNKKEGFPGESKNAYQTQSINARKGSAILQFREVPYGTYAIAILHDENKNGEMDTNLVGYPLEGYGVSNNNTYTFKGPDFEESKFFLTEPLQKLVIVLRN